MFTNFCEKSEKSKLSQVMFLIFSLLILSFTNYFLIIYDFKYLVIFISIPIAFYLAYNFDKFLMIYFVVSMFFELSFPYRIQLINLVSFIIILYFIVNKQTDLFKQEKIPVLLKLSSGLLIFAVILSSINSPHFSGESIYYAFLFINFILMSYITYRYSNSGDKIFQLINAFFYSTFFFGILIIIFIIITGKIRFADISGLAFFDFVPVSLLIGLFGYFILGKSNSLIKIAIIVIFVTLITSLSRNSWIGFTLSFIYGLIIVAKTENGFLDFVKKRLGVILIIFLFFGGLLIVTGLGSVITSRIGEMDKGLFTLSDEGTLVNNSLESRILIWLVALNAFSSNPLTGVGYFMFWKVSEQYNVLPQILYDNLVKGLDAHTTFMNFLCETGIVGLASFIFYLITMLIVSFKAIKISSNNHERKISIIIHTIVFFISVHSIYAGAFTLGQNAFQMHFFFGLAVANYVNLSRKNKL